MVSNSIDSLNSVTLLSCRVVLSGVEFVFLNSNTFLSRRMILPGVKAHFEVSLNLGRWRSLGRDRDLFWSVLLTKQNTLYLAVSELLSLHLDKN